MGAKYTLLKIRGCHGTHGTHANVPSVISLGTIVYITDEFFLKENKKESLNPLQKKIENQNFP